MPLERIHLVGPVAAKRRKPGLDLHEGLRPDAVHATLRFHARLDEPCVAQNAQVLGDGWLRQPKARLKISDRLFA